MIKQRKPNIVEERELSIEGLKFIFGKDSYGCVYVKDADCNIRSVISYTEFWESVKKGEGDIIRNSNFTFCQNEEEAKDIITKRNNIHFVPLIAEDGLCCEYAEEYQAESSFVNGVFLLMKENYDIAYVHRMLAEYDISSIKLITAEDTDTEVLKKTNVLLKSLKVDVAICPYEDFISIHGKEEDNGVLWVDMGGSCANRVRRYIWMSEGNPKKSVYYYLNDFLILIHNCDEIVNGLERYMNQAIQEYGDSDIYVIAKGKRKQKLIDYKLADKLHFIDPDTVKWNLEKEYYDINLKTIDVSKIGTLIILEMLQWSEGFYYINKKSVYMDNFLFNRERATVRFLMQNCYEKLKELKVELIFLEATKRLEILEKFGYHGTAAIQGNDIGQKNFSDDEKSFTKFLAYEEPKGTELYREIIQQTPKSEAVYTKSMRMTDIGYLLERNPTQTIDDTCKTIHIFGFCLANGVFVSEESTIASIIKDHFPGYNVLSYGSASVNTIESLIYKGTFKTGDILIVMPAVYLPIDYELTGKNPVHIIDFRDSFFKVDALTENIWGCLFHCNHIVIEQIMRDLLPELQKIITGPSDVEESISYLDLKDIFCQNVTWREKDQDDLSRFLQELEYYKREDGVCGAIVMNCNPFTLGHRFLIGQAREMVDYLYVFVVQEDKSVFPFEERFRMVCEGCKGWDNVIVLPSGSFMISALTLPGYFKKEDLQNSVLDASDDLGIFAEKIAPVLNISKRFVGTEPRDQFTAQYNKEMWRLLPDHGIEVVEIQRAEKNGDVISASRVRKALAENDLEVLKALLPASTIHILNERYPIGNNYVAG